MAYIRTSALLAAFAFATAVTPGKAAIVTYTDRSVFQSASTGDTTIDFENTGATTGNPRDFSTALGYQYAGVKFTGVYPDGYILSVIKDSSGPLAWNSGAVLYGPWYNNLSGRYIDVVLSAGITAFGLDLMTNTMPAHSIVVNLPGVTTYTVNTQSNPNRTFFGFISTTPVTEVQISGVDASPVVDNVIFGSGQAPTGQDAGQTPEIAGMLMIGSGLVFLRFVKRFSFLRTLNA